MTRLWIGFVVVGFLLSWILTGCGRSEPRDATQLAAALLVPEEIGARWKVDDAPTDGGLDPSGIVTDEQREMLPSVDMCDRADSGSHRAATALRWQAFRQYVMRVDGPVDPPVDRRGHMVFAQEFLMSGRESEIAWLFDRLKRGLEACMGAIPAGEEGPGEATPVAMSIAGGHHVAVLYRIEEAGGRGMWNVYSAFVRRGSVLLGFTLADVRLGDLEPIVDEKMLNRIVGVALVALG